MKTFIFLEKLGKIIVNNEKTGTAQSEIMTSTSL